jgi:hypothetical protein
LAFKSKTFILSLFLFALSFSFGVPFLFANPSEELSPGQSLYDRVKKLGDYGLLDPADKAVLDEGKVVTRLELAFYTEKAKARMEEPELFEGTPTSTPVPVASPITVPPALEIPAVTPSPAIPVPVPATPVPTAAPFIPNPVLPPPVVTPLPTPVVNAAIRQEIEDLLKELKQEVAMLKTRLLLDDQLLEGQAKELDSLTDLQDDVNSVWKKANESVGLPNINTKTRFRFENLNMQGVTTVNFIRNQDEVDMGMWSDLGGKGAISLGIIAVDSPSNISAASQPASISLYNPDVNFQLDGSLGHWDTHFTVEAYPGALTFGDFSRGIGITTLKNFTDPVDIKRFSDDENMKTWDDFMDNYTVAPPAALAGAVISSTDPVFDGLYGVGTNLPLVGSDARLIMLLGRMGVVNTQSDRFEEGLRFTKPLGPVQADFSAEWVNDDFGEEVYPQLDLKTYQADFGVDLSPVTIIVEGALSSLYSGVNNGVPTNTALEGPAGQAEASFYPFNLFYSGISDSFANFQSKVGMAGVNFSQYGVYPGSSYTESTMVDAYGLVGEADDLISDRYGWRANIQWDGRKQTWMKNWPSFLDDILINFNVSRKTEYRDVTDPMGYSVIEAFNFIQPYYPDDEGIWGLYLWGGYATEPWLPARQSYDNNIEDIRNDGDVSGDETRYQFTLSSERIPLIIPELGPNGKPMTYTAQTAPSPAVIGENIYTDITDIKSYNYVQLTTKWRVNKTLGFDTPFYTSLYFTDNEVSGQATQVGQTSIPNLFDQQVYDISGMYQVIRHVNLMADYGLELWRSSYTYPQVDYRTDALGCGFSYDIPWGSGRFELRYKDVTFKDVYVPQNNYHTGQWISELYFLF